MSAKITIKKNLIIFHRTGDWSAIYVKILQDYGRGMAIQTRLRRELGFTYRHHRGLEPNDSIEGSYLYSYHYEDQIHLDFYSESAQSWFELKYLNR